MRYDRTRGNRTGEASTPRILFAVAVAAAAVLLVDLIVGLVR
jgi:hypothetical protein